MVEIMIIWAILACIAMMPKSKRNKLTKDDSDKLV